MLQNLSVKTGVLLLTVLLGFQVGACSLAVAATIDVEKTRTTLLLEKEPAGALTGAARMTCGGIPGGKWGADCNAWRLARQ